MSDLVPLYITRDILARTYSLGVHSKYELRLHTRQSYFTLEARSKADEINYTLQVAAQVLSHTDYFKNSNLSLNVETGITVEFSQQNDSLLLF
jgi:hypothetical protein